MRELTLSINFGGFVGCDEEVIIEVPEDATNNEIIQIANEAFKNYILENCDYELYDEDGDVITN